MHYWQGYRGLVCHDKQDVSNHSLSSPAIQLLESPLGDLTKSHETAHLFSGGLEWHWLHLPCQEDDFDLASLVGKQSRVEFPCFVFDDDVEAKQE